MLSLVVAVTSCSKEGDTGPQGEQGAQGPKGDKGDKGEKGDTGTANVIYSGWLDVTYTQSSSGSGYGANIQAPKLTKELLANAEVKVYLNLDTDADPYIVPLPYFDGDYIINVAFYEGTIQLISNANLSTRTDATTGAKTQQIRYVIVPGGAAARQSKIDWNNYEQVKAYLGLTN